MRQNRAKPRPYVTAVTVNRPEKPRLGLVAEFKVTSSPPEWEADGTLELRDGELVVGEMHVRTTTDWGRVAGGINTSLWRAIPLGEIFRTAQELLLIQPWLHEQLLRTSSPDQREWARDVATISTETQKEKRGRKGHGDEFYRMIAETYLNLCARGFASRVLVELGKELSVSRETARDYVREARVRKWLGPATKGKAVGLPGERLRAALEEERGGK